MRNASSSVRAAAVRRGRAARRKTGIIVFLILDELFGSGRQVVGPSERVSGREAVEILVGDYPVYYDDVGIFSGIEQVLDLCEIVFQSVCVVPDVGYDVGACA